MLKNMKTKKCLYCVCEDIIEESVEINIYRDEILEQRNGVNR